MWLDADSEIYSEVTKGEAYLRKPLFLKRTCLLREASGVEMWSQDCQDHQLGLYRKSQRTSCSLSVAIVDIKLTKSKDQAGMVVD